MSAFVTRAYNFLISPFNGRQPSAGSNTRRNLNSLNGRGSISNGNGRSKIKKDRVHRASNKPNRINKPASNLLPRKQKLQPKSLLKPWNISYLQGSYNQGTLGNTEEDVEKEQSGDSTLIENKGVGPNIKREVDSEDESMTLVEEGSHQSTQDQEVAITAIQAKILEADDPRIEDWSEDEIWVFNKLVMRGREPLLPSELSSEFPSWPDILFTNNPSKLVITNHRCSMTNLASAFNRFIHEGSSTRTRLQGASNPEPPIERALKSFHKFTLSDARFRLKQNPPLICIVAAAPDEAVAHVVARCRSKMYKAGRQWRKWLGLPHAGNESTLAGKEGDGGEGDVVVRLPTIYGFLVKSSILAIMTWDSSCGEGEGEAKPVRTIGTYDWNVAGQDVWHALAVGIVECRAREYLMGLDREGLLGRDRVESDPDL